MDVSWVKSKDWQAALWLLVAWNHAGQLDDKDKAYLISNKDSVKMIFDVLRKFYSYQSNEKCVKSIDEDLLLIEAGQAPSFSVLSNIPKADFKEVASIAEQTQGSTSLQGVGERVGGAVLATLVAVASGHTETTTTWPDGTTQTTVKKAPIETLTSLVADMYKGQQNSN
jgi:hypothetical protein